MTAYLQPGDRIHIVIPFSRDEYGHPNPAAVEKDAAALIALYAAQGVTVISWMANSGLDAATVVAVFRNPTPTPEGTTQP